MSIVVRVTRHAASFCALTPKDLRGMLQALRESAGYASWDVGCWVASNRTMASLNHRYRGKGGPTDVLSFSPHQLAAPEAFGPLGVKVDRGSCAEEAPAAEAAARDLGDIIIASEYVRAACARAALDERAHYEELLCHGLVHLLGYDHETEEQHAAMSEMEEGLLRMLRRRTCDSKGG